MVADSSGLAEATNNSPQADTGCWLAQIGPCPRCGGSGRLRLDVQRSRTCLHCLGHGRITTMGRAGGSAAPLGGEALERRTVSAPVSSAA